MVAKNWGRSPKVPPSQPLQDLKALLLSVAEVMPQEDFAVDLPWLAKSCTSKEHLRFFGDVLCSVSKVAATSAYLIPKFFATDRPESFLDASEPDSFKKEIGAASAVFKQALLLAKLVNGPLAAEIATSYGMEDTIASFVGWFGRVNALRSRWGASLVEAALAWTSNLTSELNKLTPVYSHFITEKKVNKAMVIKSLLGTKVRTALSEKTMAMHRAMTVTKAAMLEWGVSPEVPKGDDDGDSSDLGCAALAFAEAKKALTVIAACSTLYENSATRVKDAAAIVAIPRPELVKSLWDELVKVAKGKVEIKAAASA